jgi:hypothetical protein
MMDKRQTALGPDHGPNDISKRLRMAACIPEGLWEATTWQPETITVFSNVSLTVFMPKALKFSLMVRLMLPALGGIVSSTSRESTLQFLRRHYLKLEGRRLHRSVAVPLSEPTPTKKTCREILQIPKQDLS